MNKTIEAGFNLSYGRYTFFVHEKQLSKKHQIRRAKVIIEKWYTISINNLLSPWYLIEFNAYPSKGQAFHMFFLIYLYS